LSETRIVVSVSQTPRGFAPQLATRDNMIQGFSHKPRMIALVDTLGYFHLGANIRVFAT
jgi:hypothetical protein